VKYKNIKSNLKKVDSHIITADEYDELPELTDEMFARATYGVGGVQQLPPRRRGPQKAPKKIAISLRLPPDVVEYFKSTGAGWQLKMGSVLQNWIKTHAHR
jgi:uncharacterized protein (DUF4415 family)